MFSILPPIKGPLKICKEIIFSFVKDTDFEDLYSEGGRPPVSPKLLMCTTILQFS